MSFIEVRVVNGFMSHNRGYDEVSDAIEYCKHLIEHNIVFDIYDPEYELCFDESDLNSVEEYFELDDCDQRNVWFLMQNQDFTLGNAITYSDDVICYGSTSIDEIIENQVRDGCFGEISNNLADFLDWERLAEVYGNELWDTPHGIFSY